MLGTLNDLLTDQIKQVCNIDLSNPCQGVQDFLEKIVKPYLQQKNIDYKEIVKQELLQYLEKNKNNTHIKQFYKNGKIMNPWIRRFTDAKGSVVEEYDLGRIFYNKAKNGGAGKGLMDWQTKEVENLVKARLQKTLPGQDINWYQPDYVANKYQNDYNNKNQITKTGVEKFCEKANQYFSGFNSNLKSLRFKRIK